MSNRGQSPGEATAEMSALRADLGESAAAAKRVGKGNGLTRGSGLLVVTRGPNAGSQFRLDQPVTSAGRHWNSDIFLDDITVSRRHAEFLRENGEFRVVDRGSRNNTHVNREPVESAVLADGDEIQIGNFRLFFFTGPTSS